MRTALTLSAIGILLLLACGVKENGGTSAPEIARFPDSGSLIVSGNPAAAQYLTGGWYPTQPDVAWSNGDAKMVLAFDSSELKTYTAVGLSLQAAVASLPIDAVIHTAGHDYTFTVSDGHGQATTVAQIPIQADASGHQELIITTTKRVVPAQFGLGPDQRTLGVGVSKIQLLTAAGNK